MILKLFFIFLCFGLCWAVEDPNIVRPCFLDDFKCMADNLAVNANCKRDVRGKVASLYRIPKFKFDTPFFNATYIDYNLKNRGRDKCFVSEFFFNKKSRNLLITIDCPNLNYESTRTYLEHRSFLEDSVYSFNINATYPLIRLTTVLPHSIDFDLCSVMTFAYVAELPKFYIDPNDPKTANYLTRDLKLLNIYERETFYWRANELARYYINSLICDFGCY
uniref:Fibrohexamerin n=1 Tax=Dendrolimus spectabilis TaxID=155323 RepID=Q9BLL6_9NEOP|nr:fibroin P25 [Dendrolimus spectabilis]